MGAAEEPEVQEGEEDSADGEFEPDGGLGGGEEAFKAAGDYEHGDDAGDEAGGFEASLGDGIFPAESAGEQHGVAESQTCGAGDDDGGKFERTVGGDEAP